MLRISKTVPANCSAPCDSLTSFLLLPTSPVHLHMRPPAHPPSPLVLLPPLYPLAPARLLCRTICLHCHLSAASLLLLLACPPVFFAWVTCASSAARSPFSACSPPLLAHPAPSSAYLAAPFCPFGRILRLSARQPSLAPSPIQMSPPLSLTPPLMSTGPACCTFLPVCLPLLSDCPLACHWLFLTLPSLLFSLHS